MAAPQEDVEKAVSDSEGSEAVPPKKTSIREYWTKEIDPRHGDWLLFACCITTGLLDSSTFRNWGSFVSMQTGRVLLAAKPSTNLC